MTGVGYRGHRQFEMSTETELHEDLGDKKPDSDDEVLRMQFLRLLFSRGSVVSGPPRLAIDIDPNPRLRLMYSSLSMSTAGGVSRQPQIGISELPNNAVREM